MLRTIAHQGINLAELLIALTIVTILAVAAIPTFLSLHQEYHLTTNINSLYYVLQYARSVSIKNNQTVYVNFSSGDSWCYGIKAGSTCNCTVANSCTLGTYSAPATQDLSLSTTGLNSNTLQFSGVHGGARVSTITFTLYGLTPSMGVSIGALGNMRVCSNQISGYPACP